MAINDKRVILWPFAVASGENAIVFSDAASGGTTSTQTIPAGTYVNRGSASLAGTTDLIAAFATAADAAYSAIYGGTSAVFDIDDDGRFTGVLADPLYIQWTHASTTLDGALLGASDTVSMIETLSTLNTGWDYQVYGRWHPGVTHVSDTGERVAHVYATARTSQWAPVYLAHSDLDDPTYRRWIEWEDIPHARMVQSAADDATAAALAGVTQGDPNAAWEALLRYLLDDTTPSPHTVYVSDVEDPASATISGPYQLAVTDGDVQVDGGVPRAWVRDDLTQWRFRCRHELVRVPT